MDIPRARVMAALHTAEGGLSLEKLRRCAGIDPSNLRATVDRLSYDGMIETRSTPEGERWQLSTLGRRWFATPAGRSALEVPQRARG